MAVGGMIVAHPTIVGELTSLFDPAERMDTARGNTSPGASSKVVVGVMMVVVATGVGQVLMRLGLVVGRISLTACCMWWRATVIRVGHLPFQPGTIRDQSAKAFEQMLSYVLKTWFMFIVYQDALEWLSAYSTVKKRNLPPYALIRFRLIYTEQIVAMVSAKQFFAHFFVHFPVQFIFMHAFLLASPLKNFFLPTS